MYVRLDLGHKFKMQIHIVSFLAHFCLLDGAKKWNHSIQNDGLW
jgi:hypothetical protein